MWGCTIDILLRVNKIISVLDLIKCNYYINACNLLRLQVIEYNVHTNMCYDACGVMYFSYCIHFSTFL